MAKTSLQKVLQPTLNAILKFKNYCEIKNIVFCIVTIPPRSGKTDFDEHLKIFFHEEKIAFLDLGSKGYGAREYLSGDAHWNYKGHEKASQLLMPFVVELLEKRHG